MIVRKKKEVKPEVKPKEEKKGLIKAVRRDPTVPRNVPHEYITRTVDGVLYKFFKNKKRPEITGATSTPVELLYTVQVKTAEHEMSMFVYNHNVVLTMSDKVGPGTLALRAELRTSVANESNPMELEGVIKALGILGPKLFKFYQEEVK